LVQILRINQICLKNRLQFEANDEILAKKRPGCPGL
jgi:hypothetical protein